MGPYCFVYWAIGKNIVSVSRAIWRVNFSNIYLSFAGSLIFEIVNVYKDLIGIYN